MLKAEEGNMDIMLDCSTEDRMVAIIKEAESRREHQSPSYVARDAAKLNALWLALAKMGFRQADIQSCLACPTCNSLTTALDWLCVHISRSDIPPEVRGAPPAPAADTTPPEKGTLTFVPNDPKRGLPEPVAPEAPSPPSPSGPPDAPPSAELPPPRPTASPGPEALAGAGEVDKAWIRQFMEQEEEGGDAEGEPPSAPTPPVNTNRSLNAKLLLEGRTLEANYRRELERAQALREKSAEHFGDAVRVLKDMEAEAKRIQQQYTGKPALQLCPLFRVNRAEVQRLSALGLEHKCDLFSKAAHSTQAFLVDPNTAKAPQRSKAEGGPDKQRRKKKEEPQPKAPREALSPAQAAEQSVDRSKDATWTGKGPQEHLRDYCRKFQYAKPMFEQVAAQPGDGPRVRLRLVIQKEGDRKTREEYTLDEAFDGVEAGREALSTLALFRLIANSRPFYRHLPPRYRDLWLRWMRKEEAEGQAEQAQQERQRQAFIQKLLADSERQLLAAERADVRARQRREAEPLPESPTGPPDEVEWTAESAVHGLASAPADEWGEDDEEEGVAGDVLESWEDWEEGAAEEEGSTDKGGAIPAAEQSPAQLALSRRLQQDLQRREVHPEWQAMQDHQQALPMFAERDHLLELLATRQVVLVSGQTGCGKTTQVPQYLLTQWVRQSQGGRCHILCTQPRRISAIAVAERVREELGAGGEGALPRVVGYQVRLQRSTSEDTQVLFCTTGILLRRLQRDPTLEDVTHVIVDEVHEMAVQSDFLLILLRDLLPKRPDLRVLLMSATLNAARYAAYFGGCATLTVEGRLFPVQDLYLEDVVEACRFPPDPYAQPPGEEDPLPPHLALLKGRYRPATLETMRTLDTAKVNVELIEQLLVYLQVHRPAAGATLIFLPGLGDIQALYDHLLDSPHGFGNPMKYTLIPLHSLLSPQEQCLVFRPSPPGIQKLVLATNVAETSITIPDVTIVIDTGRMKEVRYSAAGSLSSLTECWVSRANAEQRRGRAGRLQRGVCYHLFPRYTYEHEMEPYQQPEILRVPLDDLCLQIKVLGLGSCAAFLAKAVQSPAPEAVAKALQMLVSVNALDTEERLTPLGQCLASLPVDVHVGKLLVYAALFKCVDPIATVAAFLSLRSPFHSSLGRRGDGGPNTAARLFACHQSDHLTLWEVYRQWQALKGQDRAEREFCRQHSLSLKTLQSVQQLKQQLQDNLADLGLLAPDCDAHAHKVGVLKAVLCAGLWPNVMQVKVVPNSRGGTALRCVVGTGEEVAIHPASVNAVTALGPQWFVYFEKVRLHQVLLRDCTAVSPYGLPLLGNQPEVLPKDGVLTVPGVYRLAAPPLTASLLRQFQPLVEEALFAKLRDDRPPPRWHAPCLALAHHLLAL